MKFNQNKEFTGQKKAVILQINEPLGNKKIIFSIQVPEHYNYYYYYCAIGLAPQDTPSGNHYSKYFGNIHNAIGLNNFAEIQQYVPETKTPCYPPYKFNPISLIQKPSSREWW